MKRVLYALSFLSLAILLLGGCLSPAQNPRTAEPDIQDPTWNKRIQAQMNKGQLFQAFQDLDALQRQSSEDPAAGGDRQELDDLAKELIGKMQSERQRLLENRDYAAAYRYTVSLQNLGRQDLIEDANNPSRLLFRIAQGYLEEGNTSLAYLYVLKSLQGGGLETDQLLLALKSAVQLGNSVAAQQMRQVLEARGADIPGELKKAVPEVPPMDQMIRGTVTMWVNRGIKIERGMGFPDRVIGSGFFIDRRGYLLTNYHVIASEVDPKYEGYSRLYIKLSEKSEEKIPARVIGYDRIFDLALIKTEIEPKFIFSFAAADPPRVGDAVLAIGSPGGLSNTVTSGIVSAVERRFLQLGDAMQVDVPVNPGNSGGPLLDTKGRLVGVIFAGIEQFQGVNFAIPFSWITATLPRLYRGGEAVHPWLGMAMFEADKGLEVIYTVPEEPAYRAGIRSGDTLKSVNGKAYSKIRDVQAALLDYDPSCLVRLTWERDGKEQTGFLSLATRPFSPVETALERDARDMLFYPLFGMKLEQTGNFFWQSNYLVKRVLRGSIADETGLSVNDPVTIQGWKVDTERRYALLQIFVKKKKSGFMESVIQLAAYLESNDFI